MYFVGAGFGTYGGTYGGAAGAAAVSDVCAVALRASRTAPKPAPATPPARTSRRPTSLALSPFSTLLAILVSLLSPISPAKHRCRCYVRYSARTTGSGTRRCLSPVQAQCVGPSGSSWRDPHRRCVPATRASPCWIVAEALRPNGARSSAPLRRGCAAFSASDRARAGRGRSRGPRSGDRHRYAPRPRLGDLGSPRPAPRGSWRWRPRPG